MANSVSFRPAGFDSDSDEEGFLFGNDDNYDGGRRTSRNSHSQNNNDTATGHTSTRNQPLPSGGFGVPDQYRPKCRDNAFPEGVKTFANPQDSFSAHNGNGIPEASNKRKTITHNKSVGERSRPVQLEDFKTAVIRGNLDEIKKYIDQGISVQQVLRTGWTALMYAANYANEKVVSFLLERGADPNYQKDHYTVLMAACASTSRDENACRSCVTLLIDNGADVNTFDRYHMTPLLYAARTNKPSVIKLLIANGANKDKQDSRGYTALIWAACKGNLQSVQALLEAGVDTEKTCMECYTAKDHADHAERSSIAQILSKYSKGTNKDMVMSELSTMAAKENNVSDDEALGAKITSTHYGEFELLLLGIELGDLIPKFQENKVSFQDFLRYTDNDFQQMGITQIGVRKKLLDTIQEVHKRDWLPTSVPSIHYNKHLTCPESLAIIDNLRKHAAYMGSTVGYLGDQIRTHPDMIHKAKSKESVKVLCDKTDEAMAKVRVLYGELETFRQVLAKEIDLGDFRAPDLIERPSHLGTKPRVSGSRILVVFSVAILGLAFWKKDTLLPPLIEFWSSKTDF